MLALDRQFSFYLSLLSFFLLLACDGGSGGGGGSSNNAASSSTSSTSSSINDSNTSESQKPSDSVVLAVPTPSRCADRFQIFYYFMLGVPVASPTVAYLQASQYAPIEQYRPQVHMGTATAFSISPPLPAGLNFDPTTGEISGTPTSASLNGSTFTVTMDYINNGTSSRAACDFVYQLSETNTAETFAPTSAMGTHRLGPIAITLANGNVLVIAGSTSAAYLQTAEIYNSSTSSFAATARDMSRFGASTATLLKDGTVLIAGGYTSAEAHTPNLSLEIYDPHTDTFTLTAASLAHTPRSAILLHSGKVLFLEGEARCDRSGRLTHYGAQIFDPADGSVAATSLSGASVANILQDGNVLVRGFKGCMHDGIFGAYVDAYSTAAVIYNPLSDRYFTTAGSSYRFSNNTSPMPHTGLSLPDGKIFFSDTYYDMNFFQVYDPSTQTFSSDVRFDGADMGQPVKVLADGQILLASSAVGSFSSYDIDKKSLTTPRGIMIYNHGSKAANVVLQDGKVLVLGHNDGGPANGEIYTP